MACVAIQLKIRRNPVDKILDFPWSFQSRQLPRMGTGKAEFDCFGEPLFKASPLVKIGRLSVVPLTEEQWEWFME